MGDSRKEQTSETINNLTAQARWVADYISNSNNQMLQRSATLIGFLAFEFAFIAAWNPLDFKDVCYFKWFFGIGILLAFGSVTSFVWGGKVKYFHYLNFQQIEFALTLQPKDSKLEPLNAFFYKNDGLDLFEELFRENGHISKFFKLGTSLLLAAQFFFGLLILIRWMNI